MFRTGKRAALTLCKYAGGYRAVATSQWRRRRLLILCYHGISLRDEHEWHPRLYVPRTLFEKRIRRLKADGYRALPLADAVQRLYRGDLPERAVCVTFDDGAFDFYRQAYPVLAGHGIPATVYLTSFFCTYNRPVFGPMCSYLLWKGKGASIAFPEALRNGDRLDLRSPHGRQAAWNRLVDFARGSGLCARQKDEMAACLARRLGIDYDELVGARVLQLMNPGEVAELSAAGVDFQLHTHRHRTPHSRELFEREVRENREAIHGITGAATSHFCYPSGVVDPSFLPWLRQMNIVSATTCQPGMASPDDEPLLLPRFQDSSEVSDIEFDGWLSGFTPLLYGYLRRGGRN